MSPRTNPPQYIIDAAEDEIRYMNGISRAAWPLAREYFLDDINETIDRRFSEQFSIGIEKGQPAP